MAVIVLLLGIGYVVLGVADLAIQTARRPRPKPINNAEWFAQRRRGIRHPHAEIAPERSLPAAVIAVCVLAGGAVLIVDAFHRLWSQP